MNLLKKIFIAFLIAACILRPAISSAQTAAVDGQSDIIQSGETGDETNGNQRGQEESTTWSSAGEDSSTYIQPTLTIDNKNKYKGMEKNYSEGYVPAIKAGNVNLVLPIICDGKLKNDTMRVSVNLGDTQTSPFVYKNYEKNVSLKSNKVNNSKKTVKGYLVNFSFKLKKERYNGSYPVVISVKANDVQGNAMEQEFTVYVNITDGKNPNEEVTEPISEPETEGIVFEPRVMVESYEFSKKTIEAGDEVTVKIALMNTSKTDDIRNMAVTAGTTSEFLELTSETDSIYVDHISAGKTGSVSYQYRIKASAPQGQYDIDLSMNYADAKGNTYAQTGKVKVDVVQSAKVQFDPLIISSEAEIGDVIEAQVNAMNLGRGKVYNVRAELKADGLTPKGTIFIGDIEAGQAGTGSIQVSVGGLSEGSSLYGDTEGTVTFYYENESGEEWTEEAKFSMSIQSPFSTEENTEEEQTGQWWILMAVIIGLLCVFSGYSAFRVWKRRKENAMVE